MLADDCQAATLTGLARQLSVSPYHLSRMFTAHMGTLASFTLRTNGVLTPITVTASGGAALCWVTTDGRHFYASNSGSGTVTTYTNTLADRGDTATDAGPVDATISSDGGTLYVQTGVNGIVDEFRIANDGTLHRLGTVTVDASAGGEGIAAS